MNLLTSLITETLVQLHNLTGNLGLSILSFTFIVRSLLLPLSLPAAHSQKKIMKLQPELAELKKKHKDDQKAFNMAQIELYKKYNINPLTGCLPQLLQIGLLIVLYQVLHHFVSLESVNGVQINSAFGWLDLRKPDSLYIIPVLAGVTQLIMSVMILPGGEVPDLVPNKSKDKKIQTANKAEESQADMAAMMQKQMLFVLPVMTGVFAINFPSGLGLYWVATTVYSIVQQYFLTGPGGLRTYTRRFFTWLKAKTAATT